MKFRNASAASYCSTLIETFFKSESGEMIRVGYGTGFFTKIDAIDCLVTNWHVLTNRDPNDANKTLHKDGDSPTHFQLHVPREENEKHFVPLDFVRLYDDQGLPVWLEEYRGFEWADIAVVPGILPADCFCPRIEDFAPTKGTVLEPGIDVCLIGFPFGRNDTNPFPIWKKAMIASEPAYTIDGKPFAYLDTPGRPGMSGSPVYAISDSILVSNEAHAALTNAQTAKGSSLDAIMALDPEALSSRGNHTKGLEFVWIYSGSTGDKSLDHLNLGRFWPASVLDSIRRDAKRGTNPVPPELH